MEASKRELFIIAGAMLCFLSISITAVALFVRQWRRERAAPKRPPGPPEPRIDK